MVDVRDDREVADVGLFHKKRGRPPVGGTLCP
jgi:hypothetical protein